MSKTIEVYLWLNEPDGYVIDLVIDGETVHSLTTTHQKVADEKFSQLSKGLGLIYGSMGENYSKMSNQWEKK